MEMNWKQVFHITEGYYSERALESQEKEITKRHSIFRKITIIKSFPWLLRGKDNNHKCNGEIKIDFVKSHFLFFASVK